MGHARHANGGGWQGIIGRGRLRLSYGRNGRQGDNMHVKRRYERRHANPKGREAVAFASHTRGGA